MMAVHRLFMEDHGKGACDGGSCTCTCRTRCVDVMAEVAGPFYPSKTWFMSATHCCKVIYISRCAVIFWCTLVSYFPVLSDEHQGADEEPVGVDAESTFSLDSGNISISSATRNSVDGDGLLIEEVIYLSNGSKCCHW